MHYIYDIEKKRTFTRNIPLTISSTCSNQLCGKGHITTTNMRMGAEIAGICRGGVAESAGVGYGRRACSSASSSTLPAADKAPVTLSVKRQRHGKNGSFIGY
ncbi:hypothetical protein CHS0354_004505 [Potamilus streckersoni]|uniref:Uncharacterized protein n=1 Tax=Potamilus streckersoni TaxID=2493646 RepID=A0AAE0VQL7_9BIVA|nr:hypothetical protein CHS0354_004505 [Potamilus streckersoni]